MFSKSIFLLPNDAVRLFHYLLPCIAVPFIYVLAQRRLYGYLHGFWGTFQTRKSSKVLFLSSDVFCCESYSELVLFVDPYPLHPDTYQLKIINAVCISETAILELLSKAQPVIECLNTHCMYG